MGCSDAARGQRSADPAGGLQPAATKAAAFTRGCSTPDAHRLPAFNCIGQAGLLHRAGRTHLPSQSELDLVVLGSGEKEAGVEATTGRLLPPAGAPHFNVNVV